MIRPRHILRTCFACAVLVWGVSSCKNPDPVRAVSRAPYFSLADYFSQEATRLQQLNPAIVKTVAKNGEQERKEIHVIDWQKELALFIDADINKPAWQNSYRADSTETSVTYKSIDPKLRTAEITVETQEDGSIKHIHIVNKVSNMLYQTDEALDYYPDSLYRITKQQHVWVMGDSDYTVTGHWQ